MRFGMWLMLVATVSCQYGCQLTLSNCTGNGICRDDGLCICGDGYLGENCELKVAYSPIYGQLGKSFIAGWIIFWVLLNTLVPYLIFLLILYCKKKNSSDLKEHFWDCYEACCCCIMPPSMKKKRQGQAEKKKPVVASKIPRFGGTELFSARDDPMAPISNSIADSKKPGARIPIETSHSRPMTSADKRDVDSMLQSEHLQSGQSRSHLLESSSLVQAEHLLKKQSEIMKRQKIPLVTDQLSIMQQMYQYDDFEEYENEEEHEQDIKEEERLLKIKTHIKYKDMVNMLYK